MDQLTAKVFGGQLADAPTHLWLAAKVPQQTRPPLESSLLSHQQYCAKALSALQGQAAFRWTTAVRRAYHAEMAALVSPPSSCTCLSGGRIPLTCSGVHNLGGVSAKFKILLAQRPYSGSSPHPQYCTMALSKRGSYCSTSTARRALPPRLWRRCSLTGLGRMSCRGVKVMMGSRLSCSMGEAGGPSVGCRMAV